MSPARRSGLVATLLVLLGLLLPIAGPSHADDRSDRSDRSDRGHRAALVGADEGTPGPATGPRGRFQGSNGRRYAPAPQVVPAARTATSSSVWSSTTTALEGRRVRPGPDRLAQLAHTIERSGRQVVFTAAPNKSLVVTDTLRKHALPHGRCDSRAEQPDPGHGPLRRPALPAAAPGAGPGPAAGLLEDRPPLDQRRRLDLRPAAGGSAEPPAGRAAALPGRAELLGVLKRCSGSG